MINCSLELENYYNDKVVLPRSKQEELWEKRKINVQRIKGGIYKYNKEHNTNYKVIEDLIQGSMRMSTVVQNDFNDYDIDVAVVFEKENIYGMGPMQARNMVAEALKKETSQFAEEPEVKTGCVRLKYSDGYHVDFAVYRITKKSNLEDDYYEHAGAEWSARDLRALGKWFDSEIKNKEEILRKVVRLSKTFCKSRESWKKMPSGLIQTVICDECLDMEHNRLDEIFYYTMIKIINRLNFNTEVKAPVDNFRLLTNREVDRECVRNWKTRLEAQMKKLEVLFKDDCCKAEALNAWSEFFNNDYFLKTENNRAKYIYDNTEEFIEDIYTLNIEHNVNIECIIRQDGFRDISIKKILENEIRKCVPKNMKVIASINKKECPEFDKIFWKVKNTGEEAEKRNNIRGQILNRGIKIEENTIFNGKHYIECYLVKNEVCIGKGHVDVPIGE